MFGMSAFAKEPSRIPKPLQNATHVTASQNRAYLSASSSKAISLWPFRTWDTTVSVGVVHGDVCTAVNDDGTLVLFGDASWRLKAWKPPQEASTLICRTKDKPYSIAMFADSKTAVVGTWNGDVSAINLINGKTLWASDHGNGKVSVALSASGSMMASAASDGSVRLWNPANGAMLHQMRIQRSAISQVRFSDSGKYLVIAGGFDGVTYVVELGRREVSKFRCEGVVNSADMSPDDRFVVAGTGTVAKQTLANKSGCVFIWEFKSGRLMSKYAVHGIETKSIVILKDGNTIVSSGTDGVKLTQIEIP